MPYDDELTTDRDKIRALLGDTESTALLTDAHYDAVLSLYDFNGAVAFLANELAATYARKPGSVTLYGLSVSWRDRVATWLALAKAAINGSLTGATIVAPFIGGISITEKEVVLADTDRVANVFTKDLHGDEAKAIEECV